MTLRAALALINTELAPILLGEIAEVDAETHFAISWFDSYSYERGKYGDADVKLKTWNAGLDPLRDSGVLTADRGTVQLIRPSRLGEVVPNVLAERSIRAFPAWSQLMYLIAALTSEDGGIDLASDTLTAIGGENAERLKDIAYHCYLVCDKAKRSTDAQDFNALVTAWPELQKLGHERSTEPKEQRLL